MCVSASARGRTSPSPARRCSRPDAGPGSTMTSPTSQAPITRSRPVWKRSMTRISAGGIGPRTLQLAQMSAPHRLPEPKQLQGTTQNDIIKEFLARGTYAFPPGPSMRLIADMVAYTVENVPQWNPINICSYHLQEAGATPVQEIAYALSNAIAVLDAVRARVDEELMGKVFSRISFFVNAGVRFVEEHAKLRAMGQIWEHIGR